MKVKRVHLIEGSVAIVILIVVLIFLSGNGVTADQSEATYVGTDACKPCHSNQYNTWDDTFHGTSFFDDSECTQYEEIAEQAAFKLADRLGRLERALREADLTMCYRQALNICGVASQIGLVDVAKVASDVLTCTGEGNMEALSAVVGRLNRVAEASLFSVFELEA